MELVLQALVMGLVQGLTEFLPISSSGHLVLVPWLLGWDDAFVRSLAFSVVLHGGTLAALLVYFRRDWARLVPAGLAALRDRSLQGDPDRRLAWLLAASTIPAGVAGLLLDDTIEQGVRGVGSVATLLVVAGGVLWLADRWGRRDRPLGELGFRHALAIGAAQALALVPGVSRSGISMSAGLFAGLDRSDAARFSFLMATPITVLAVAWELRKVLAGEAGPVDAGALAVGVLASFAAGLAAIAGLLRFVRSRSFDVFVAYRVVLAAVVFAAWLLP